MSIELFSYGQDRLRTSIVNGEPAFNAADVCSILDIRNSRDAISRLDDDEKGVGTTDTLGGMQSATYVTESGLYSLVFTSRKPEAKAFKRWITGTVLPALRKTGTYSTAPTLTDDELIHQALSISATRVAALTERVAELEPKAELAENYLTASAGSRLIGEAAKILDMKGKELRAFLLDERMIFVRHAQCGNVLYDFYADFAPHFEARETVVNHTWGSCNHYTLRITPRGIDLIRKRIRDRKAAA
ncbi:phage antirepressor [Rhodococcus sp. IEGM 1318]|uniref:phage antirepressor n=1 Tax=Rhodococcus sp. IEGM 1318 TaxID=3082226 RepID=UPI002955C4AB|nr:BRO family protein [Rhodococcus sp. IEGM 1318]MDV8005010.1 BRO family protein [Rhodococcus sp. IEGM 1318]